MIQASVQATLTELENLMQDVVGTLLPVRDLTPETNLFDAGLDSMAVAQLLLEVETRTGIWLDESLQTPENLGSCRALAQSVFGVLATKQ